jgi:desulfoferrodoxin-like iron-binding protein
MKRREAFKKLGILTLLGAGGVGVLSACTNTAEKTAPVAAATPEPKEAEPINGWTSERNKLIINREPQTIVDPENPTKAELKHTPDITFGDADEKGNTMIKVTIGKDGIIHPATAEHWIDYLTLFINDKQYSHNEYVNGGIRGFETFFATLKKGDKVKVESGCNLHGIWTNEVVF